jgi:copper chaperone CopZ
MVAIANTRRLLLSLAAAFPLLGFPDAVLAAEPPPLKGEAQADAKTIVIPVEGMVCYACAATVKKSIKSIAGVIDVEVSLEKRTAKVTYAANKVSAERIAAAIDQAGYKAGLPRGAE